jgi:choline-glycine betaine transporter
LAEWRTSVTLNCTWLYQGSKVAFFFFLVYITVRYGHVHLARTATETPDFTNMSFFCMMFAAGAGPALFVWNVQEPLYHRAGGNFFVNAGYRTQDENDMFALTMTMASWGIINWAHLMLSGIAMSLAANRFGMPMIFRSAFYPQLGAYTWGWIGDFIDGLTVVLTVSGICTAFGVTVIYLTSSLIHLGLIEEGKTVQETVSIQNVVISIITALSTATVISGLHGAIHNVSVAAVSLGFALMLLVLAMDDTKFLLNVSIQEVGMFLQYNIFQLNFWTDAFGQLRPGSGRAIDGKAADADWMSSWMVFYLAWAVAWAPFVGVFFACISRGRRIWEMVLYGLVAPIGYCIVWFCTWGGIAFRQSRQGMELQRLGETHYNNSAHFLSDGSNYCYDVPQQDVVLGEKVIFTKHLSAVTPVCQFDDSNTGTAVFDILQSFKFSEQSHGNGWGPLLSIVFLLGVPLAYLAVSANASLVVDNLACNGRKNNHWSRRMFWTVTSGALTAVLLSSGSTDAANALQAASIVSAVPFAVLLCYLMQSVLLQCQAAERLDYGSDYVIPDQPEFEVPIYGGVFNVFEYFASLGRVTEARVKLGMHCATRTQVVEFVKGLVVPFVSLGQVLTSEYPQNPKTNAAVVAFYAVVYAGWIIVWLAGRLSYPGSRGLAWMLMIMSGGILAAVRSTFRGRYNVRSNVVADLVASTFFWPQVLAQMRIHGHSHLLAQLRIHDPAPIQRTKKARAKTLQQEEESA